MARTTQRQFSSPDGAHIGARLERQARPAGRLAVVLDEALQELADMDVMIVYRTAPAAR